MNTMKNSLPLNFKPLTSYAGFPCAVFREPFIINIEISAPGAEVYMATGSSAGDLAYIIPATIYLRKVKDHVTVANVSVLNGQTRTYKGRRSLTVSNTTVQSGGNASFTSANEITLLPGFTATGGSDVDIYIATYDCSEWQGFDNNKSVVHIENQLDDTNEYMTLNFLQEDNISKKSMAIASNPPFQEERIGENSITVYPNPATNAATIRLQSNNPDVSLIGVKLYDVYSRRVMDVKTNGHSHAFDVTLFPQGLYFIEASDGVQTYYHKLIIQSH